MGGGGGGVNRDDVINYLNDNNYSLLSHTLVQIQPKTNYLSLTTYTYTIY